MYSPLSFRTLRSSAAFAALGAAAFFSSFASVQGQAVLTQDNDNARTGANRQELVLTPANVNVNQFGKLFTRTLDADVNGQVLYVPQVLIHHAARNVIYAYTSNNTDQSPCSLYAFDADDPNASDPLWHTTLPNSATYTTPTPVIDPAASTLYVLTKTDNDDTGATYLHAIDITTGGEKPGSPIHIQASAPGTGDGSVNGVVSFDGPSSASERFHANDRAALLLANGRIYAGFAHNSDSFPYHGWLLAYQYDGTKFTQTSAFCTTPNGGDGGIWQAGKGLTADASGNVYCTVGNGTFDIDAGGKDYGMCVLKLTSALKVASWFAPFDEQTQSDGDLDFGNVGVTLIPGTGRLFTGGTKFGAGFVLDTTALGGFTPNGPDAVVQRLDNLTPVDSVGQNAVCWDTGSDKSLYLWPYGGNLKQLRYDPAAGKLNPAGAYKQGTDDSGATLAVSANGNSNGILWAVDYNHVVHAFDASDITRPELWNSSLNADRDALPSVGHFQFPTVVNGKVYVPTGDHSVVVYGLLPASTTATKTHLLWDNGNTGQVSLWTRDSQTGNATQNTYGPFSGWTARAVADGADGVTRLLWTNVNGQTALWRVASNGTYTSQTYGPYTGWTARGVSVAQDNAVHILWNKTDGTASLWRVNAGGSFTSALYGPFSGWTARAVADGPDGQTRLLWNNVNGQTSLWRVAADNSFTAQQFGPYAGWTATALAVGPDNGTRLVWNNTGGEVSLWCIDGAGSAADAEYGPYSGWQAVGVTLDSGDVPRLLWDNTNGAAALWSRDGIDPFASAEYGPYSGWQAVAVSAGP